VKDFIMTPLGILALVLSLTGTGTALAQKQRDKLVLELVILANSTDDKEAIEDARRYFEDAANKAEIEKCQKDGLPPPAPRTPGSAVSKKYPLELSKGREAHLRAKKAIETAAQKLQAAEDEAGERAALKELEAGIERLKTTFPLKSYKSVVTYRWVEIRPRELRYLDLDNAAESEPARSDTWKQAKAARTDGRATTLRTGVRQLWNGALFYSRECQNRNLSEEQRRQQKVEYFVLARNPEIDPKDPRQEKETPRLGSNFVVSARPGKAGKAAESPPTLEVQLSKEGAQWLATLSRKNATSVEDQEGQVRRHLAILIDGQVVSAPTFWSEMTSEWLQIMTSPPLTTKEIDNLIERLRPKKK